jgi:hypothetical protein
LFAYRDKKANGVITLRFRAPFNGYNAAVIVVHSRLWLARVGASLSVGDDTSKDLPSNAGASTAISSSVLSRPLCVRGTCIARGVRFMGFYLLLLRLQQQQRL